MSWLNQPYQGGYGQQGFQQGLTPQQTGYAPQQLQGQRTGFQPQGQFQQPQPTGFMGGGLRPQMPLQGQPTGFAAPMQRPMATGFPQQPSFHQQPSFQQPQPTGFGAQPTGGFGGVAGGAMPSQFLSSFMPAPNTQPSTYMDPAQMQFAANPGHSLEQQFQQQNQAHTGQAAVPIPWALTADEKKRYDQIFRAWDQQGTGFIEGRVSKEVFGQAGLDQNDLMAIWNLADVNDRGKLNIDEFHVAMGLIYRRLNGNPIPQVLPAEMAPPSARDLDDSVGFLTSLLKNDTNQRSTNQSDYDGGRGSMAKARSLHDTAPQPNRKDATVFRNNDNEAPVYKSSARHLNRDDVRSRSDRDSPSSDLEDVKQRLKTTQSALDRSRDQDDEEEDLKDELRNMNRRIQRVQDDLEYNLRSGRRSAAKDDERRKLERELLKLEHEELPALERRIEEKERDKRRDKQKYALERDSRNRNDRYSDDRDRYSSSRDRSGYNSDRRSPERGYNRGTYDSRDDRDSSRDRSRYSSPPRRGSSPRSRTPPPPPAPVAKVAPAPPPVPAAPAAAAPPAANLKSMNAEERAAHRRAEAQRRVQERLRALGVAAPSSGDSPAVDTTVADRLEQDRLDALKRSEAADEEIKNKELERKAKLEKERLKGVAIEQAINQNGTAAVEQVRAEVQAAHPAPAVEQAANAQLDAEEEALAKKEEALKKEKAERLARIAKLEEEAKEAEENLARSRAMFAPKTAKVPPPPPASRGRPAPAPARKAPPPSSKDDDDFAPSVPPPAPAAPPAPAPASLSPPVTREAAVSPGGESRNPFHRLQGNGASPTPPSTVTSPGTTKPNPFFAAPSPPAPPPAPAAPPAPPAPAAPRQQAPVAKAPYRPPPTDDDWDAGGLEKDADESDSDDEGAIGGVRAAQANLAANLFRGLGLGPARPPSAQASTPSRSAAASPAPGAPAPPPAPPAAPAAPRAPPAVASAPIEAPNRSALLGAIQGGLKLKKAVTKDKSGPAVAGAVIGDPSPPVQVYQAPSPPPSPPPAPRAPSPPPAPREPSPGPVPSGAEYAALDEETPETLPAIADEDPMDAVDLSTTHRMLSVYAYEGQRPEDLSFPESVVILANPAKDSSSDWWYGRIETSGASGWIPKSYVEAIKAQSATALYAYAATSDEELSFEEGDRLSIVDSSDESWWKAERGGLVGLVPATYVELSSSEASLARRSSPSVDKQVTKAPPLVSLSPPPSARTIELSPDSSDDSSDEDSEDESSADQRDPKEREAERLRVLQAAGLLVFDEHPPRRRRAAPARPARPPKSSIASTDESRTEEPSPSNDAEEDEAGREEETEDEEERMEDAFDLYQRAMRELPPVPSANRLSVASFDTAPSLSPNLPSRLSPPPSPAPTAAPSTTAAIRESWHSTASHLRARMGRNTTSASGDRARPVVSGPMPSSPTPDETTSPSFGSSWSSLIDASALEELGDRERKRQESIFEFIMSEQAYVQSLQLIIEVFFTALQPILAEKASQVVFANIEDILMFNTIFLSELEDRQRVARLYIDTIGDVIKTHMKGLDVYRGYCINQANAARTLADLKASDPKLRAVLDGSRVKGLELEHFLLEPMQRLTRYPLLINQILRYTDSDHPDTATLARALEIAESTTGAVNETIRKNENEEKLRTLTNHLEFAGVDGRLNLTAPTRFLGPRQILKEGKVAKAKSGRSLNLYLFNDLLLLTENRGGVVEAVYRFPMPLEEVATRDSNRDDLGFQIRYRGDTVNVRAATARQCMTWTREIDQARKACVAALQQRRMSSA